MFRHQFLVMAIGFGAVAGAIACEEQPPPKAPERTEQVGVPVNSVSDARLRGEEDPADRAMREEAAEKNRKEDPTEPLMTKVGEAPPPTSKPEPRSSSSGGKGPVSKYECDRAMDKYLELEIAHNPQLRGVPPEVVEQAKQMAREKHGDAPCTATRAQYNCAMAATSTAAWQRCMK